MSELLLFGTEPSWAKQILFFISVWLTGMGVLVSSLVIVGFIGLIAISYD